MSDTEKLHGVLEYLKFEVESCKNQWYWSSDKAKEDPKGYKKVENDNLCYFTEASIILDSVLRFISNK